jgi:hypothetical protein
VGKLSVISVGQLFEFSGICYAETDYKSALNSVWAGKEIMQSGPDLSKLLEKQQIEQAKALTNAGELQVLHNLSLAAFLRTKLTNQQRLNLENISWRSVLQHFQHENKQNKSSIQQNLNHLEQWSSVSYSFNPESNFITRLFNFKLKNRLKSLEIGKFGFSTSNSPNSTPRHSISGPNQAKSSAQDSNSITPDFSPPPSVKAKKPKSHYYTLNSRTLKLLQASGEANQGNSGAPQITTQKINNSSNNSVEKPPNIAIPANSGPAIVLLPAEEAEISDLSTSDHRLLLEPLHLFNFLRILLELRLSRLSSLAALASEWLTKKAAVSSTAPGRYFAVESLQQAVISEQQSVESLLRDLPAHSTIQFALKHAGKTVKQRRSSAFRHKPEVPSGKNSVESTLTEFQSRLSRADSAVTECAIYHEEGEEEAQEDEELPNEDPGIVIWNEENDDD